MIEVLKQALEALETPKPLDDYPPILNAYAKTINNAITSLRQAIAELESQEPDAWRYGALLYHDKLDAMEFIRTSGYSYLLEPLYTHPQRTEEEPVAWHEPGAYGNVTTHKDWALANGWEPLYKERT
jgi:hypothetical protein